MNIKLLMKLLLIETSSYEEQKIAEFIKDYLNKNNIKFKEDEMGNIFNISKNAPLLSAHMDTVQTSVDNFKLKTIKVKNGLVYGDGIIIGGDDKCGIYLILELLKDHDLNFLFSIGEEIGGKGSKYFIEKNNITHIPYGLVLDRKGSSDIICTDNQYGVEEFENFLVSIGKGFNYKKSSGLFSDADFLSEQISCANISVGYYNQHTNREFINLQELENAHKFVHYIIKNVKTEFNAPEKGFEIILHDHDESKYWWDEFDTCLICNRLGEHYIDTLNSFICSECLYSLKLDVDTILEEDAYYFYKEKCIEE